MLPGSRVSHQRCSIPPHSISPTPVSKRTILNYVAWFRVAVQSTKLIFQLVAECTSYTASADCHTTVQYHFGEKDHDLYNGVCILSSLDLVVWFLAVVGCFPDRASVHRLQRRVTSTPACGELLRGSLSRCDRYNT